MFGWLRRFDDWLEQKDREANPRYVPQNFAIDIETDPIDEEESSFDWEGRRKAVEVLVKAEARKVFKTLSDDHAVKYADFTSWAKTNANMLIVSTPTGRFSINRQYLLTVEMVPGRAMSKEEDGVYVTYSKTEHRIETDPRYVGRMFGSIERYFYRQWPKAAIDDAITFVGVEGQRINIIGVPFGRGDEFYSQIMDAIGGR